MNKIPTAHEFIINHPGYLTGEVDDETLMIEFAKLHADAAVKAKIEAMEELNFVNPEYSLTELDKSTGNIYSQNNIK